MEDLFIEFCRKVFYPLLAPVFTPINESLADVYQPWASLFAIGLFVLAMIMVAGVLDEKYVNRGRLRQKWYTDLRLWTVLSMLPHVIFYFYFR